MANAPKSNNKKLKKRAHITCLRLPVAPQANSRVRYADERPSLPAMMPAEAVAWVGDLLKGGKRLKAVNINGPGDALAAPGPTMEVLDLLRREYPELETRVTTLALGAKQMAYRLAAKGVKRVNLEVDGVSSEVIEKIYAWIRPEKKTVSLKKAAQLLLKEQQAAIGALKEVGIDVHVQTTIYPEINEQHVKSIAKQVALLGASSISFIPFQPGELFTGCIAPCDDDALALAEKQAAAYLEVVSDDEDYIPSPGEGTALVAGALPKPSKERPNVAVASSNGMDVDLHLGQASTILIYGPRGDGLACLLESRLVPGAGNGQSRWEALCKECLHDCFVLLAANVGEKPKKVLAEFGLKILITEENVEGLVDMLCGGGKKKAKK